ncbi:MAG TPA: TonB family protein [Dongiaceae bacterium]
MSVIFAERVDSEERTQLLQWGISLLAVLAVHIGVAFWLLPKDTPAKPDKPPPAAFLDLAPIKVPDLPGSVAPLAPAQLPSAAAPAPTKAPEVKPEQPVVKPPPPEVPKIAVPPPAPPVATPAKPPAPKPPMPKPQPPKPQVQEVPPQAGPPSLTGSQPIVRLSPVRAWQAAVIVQITNLRKWPPEAVRQQMRGSVVLFMRVDREGNIVEYGLRGSSGYALLDRATLDMARRAVKLAPLPPQIPGQTYDFNLTIDWL